MEKGKISNLEKEPKDELRYLLYFQPSQDLENLIFQQESLRIPNSELHSTLCVFNMDTEKEEEIIDEISEINFNPFEIETLNFDNFANDSLVLKISRPEELLKLHYQIINVVEKYATEDFNEIKKKYFLEKYNPHLTIAKSSSNFDTNSKDLIGKKDKVEKYSIAKKVDGIYYKIKEFYSAD